MANEVQDCQPLDDLGSVLPRFIAFINPENVLWMTSPKFVFVGWKKTCFHPVCFLEVA